MNNVTYPSRVDTWLVLVLLCAVGLVLFQALSLYPRSPSESLLSLGTLVAMFILGLLIGYPCEYTLTEAHLVVRSGLIRRRIPYSEITGVEPSRSLWSAPALSLRRVKVSYAGRFQLVSPKEREQFIQALTGRVSASGSKQAMDKHDHP